MKTPLHVLYIPGLGDTRVIGQRLVVGLWRIWGVEAEVFQMRWAGQNEDWAAKLSRLLARIDELTASDRMVTLVGASAGATAVVNAYALRKPQIAGCVLIAAKVNFPETIGEALRQENPAFFQSAVACERALQTLDAADRQRILSRFALDDHVVTRRDSAIGGAENQVLPMAGHALTIGTQLLFGAPSFLRFLKRTAVSETK